MIKNVLLWTLVAFFLIFLLPLLVVILLTFALYRKIISLLLGKELLSGEDAIWSLDCHNKESKGVVNIAFLLDGTMEISELWDFMKNKIMPASQKLCMRRRYFGGYFYWEPMDTNVKDLVRIFPGCEKGVTIDEMREKISAISNKPLPFNNEFGWELLLIPKILGTGSTQMAFLFRIHHSIGDGPSVCRVILDNAADIPDNQAELIKKLSEKARNVRHPRPHEILLEGASSLAEMVLDKGPLTGAPLCGSKQVCWRTSASALHAAHNIRKVTGAPFSAILITALTDAITEFGAQRKTPLQSLTLGIPVQPHFDPTAPSKLESTLTFSVVQIKPQRRQSTLERVQTAATAVKESVRPAKLALNNLLVRLAGTLLPRALASLVLRSVITCSVGLSNMPGPSSTISIAGHELKDFGFWVPNWGNTGVGAAILSYAGQLTLGLIIDEAFLSSEKDSQILTEAWERHLLKIENELCTK